MTATTLAGDGGLSYRRGVLLILLGSLTSSWIGLGVRSVEAASAWQLLVYRSFGMAAFLLLVIWLRHPGRLAETFRGAGLAALVGAFSLAVGASLSIFAIQQASVANAMFLMAASPFLAAVLARALLKERVRPATWLAIACAFAGVAVMVTAGIAVGDLWGNLAGLGSALCIAGFVVALRHGRRLDMLPLSCLAGAIGMALALAFCLVEGSGLAISTHDALLGLAMGVFQLGLSLVLVTLGSRSVPAAELSLLTMTEMVAAPLWVWLVLGEGAGPLMFAGGALVLLAVAFDAVTGLRERRRVATERPL